VSSESGFGDNKKYIVIAIVISTIIIISVFFSSNELNEAKIEDNILGDSWEEDLTDTDGGSKLLGLEKWVSYTYRNYNESFPAYITLTSMKTIFLLNEDELIKRTKETIDQATNKNIILDKKNKTQGERVLLNGHKTQYIIYEGIDKNDNESIRIIGETWNCQTSGTSIICIGYAKITNDLMTNNEHWAKIIKDGQGTFGIGKFMDTNGLIYNVKCH